MKTAKRRRIKSPRTQALLVRLEPGALAALRESAAAAGMSMSALIALAASDWLRARTAGDCRHLGGEPTSSGRAR